MTTKSRIVAKLTAAFEPSVLEVIDESERHRSHAGAPGGAETHFRVVIGAAALGGLSRLEQHRAVMDCLAEELAGSVHALAIEVRPA